jgi:NADH dehydrogenase [ubiquinone] 1 alpha subcomplex assembly factor 5
MAEDAVLFDRAAVRRHRDRAAPEFDAHDFLHREVADRMADRLADIRRTFPVAVNLGAAAPPVAGAEITATLDLSAPLLSARGAPGAVAADEEFLPLASGSVDLAVSCLSLHWTNDLPGALIQIRRALRPDGLFMAALLGGDTLIELRQALMEAEAETTGGARPRTSPVIDVAEAGGLLQRAGFALPVIDTDTITVTFPDLFALLRDLRGMGETNALAAMRAPLRRDTLVAAAARYAESYADADGRIPATFQIVWLTGWAPADGQQRALRPGSAAARLSDALETKETPAGDKAAPGD